MVVQHNLQAMNANRMLGITQGTVANATEKLSSGYRINRAADDAAGLSISEKMRKQIRGLDQASTNAEDGISSVQTAEGALAEVQDMLQRMNELCVQAANGTNSSTDRRYIQDEIDQLISEIDRVAETTKFNDTYLLKGDSTNGLKETYVINYSVTYTRNVVSNSAENAKALDYKANYTGTSNIYMVKDDILSITSGSQLPSAKITNGDDITPYMEKVPEGSTLTLTTKVVGADVTYKNSGVTLLQNAGTTMANYYRAGSATPLSYDEMKECVDYDAGTRKFSIKNGVILYTNAADAMANNMAGQQVTDADINDTATTSFKSITTVVSNKLYSAAPPSAANEVTEANLKNYFPDATNGQYSPTSATLKLYTSTGDLVGADAIDNFVNNPYNGIHTKKIDVSSDITTAEITVAADDFKNELAAAATGATVTNLSQDLVANVADNQAGARLSENYVAFISVELDSNVATGNNGNISSQITGGNLTADLSTDGIDTTVKANRTLYIYNKDNGSVTKIAAGNDMSTYLKSDNTMAEGYMLVDILDSDEQGTSQKVKDQFTNGNDFKWDNNYIKKTNSLQNLYDADGNVVSGMKLNSFFDENGNYKGGLFTTDQARTIDKVFSDAATDTDEYQNLLAQGYEPSVISNYIMKAGTKVSEDLEFKLHVGADSTDTNKINVNIISLTAAGLGVDKLSSFNVGIVDETGNNATDAIDIIAEAIQRVSTQRSALGAVQNRLEHTIKNLDNVVENTTAAESQIRDTDMAEEMVRYSNNNVLQQAGQSMLAQANQANQGILSLLQ